MKKGFKKTITKAGKKVKKGAEKAILCTAAVGVGAPIVAAYGLVETIDNTVGYMYGVTKTIIKEY